MTKASQDGRHGADTRDQVKKGLSEVRTVVLGAQILLGFQYEALFQKGFGDLSALRKSLELAAFGLLLVALVLIIAPAPFHQLSERGESTTRQGRFTKLMLGLSLAPFAAGIGVNVVVAAAGELGTRLATAVAVTAVLACLFLWYGIELMFAQPRLERGAGPAEPTALKDKVADLMTETRIVLPGVQALLGFQFAAYLTEAFGKLPPGARLAHDISLVLLLTSMVLLMTPAPFHRLAEDGRDTERLCRVSARLILAALGALAFALAADLYVAARVVTGSSAAASGAAAAAALVALIVWFAWPRLARGRGSAAQRRPDARSEEAVRHA